MLRTLFCSLVVVTLFGCASDRSAPDPALKSAAPTAALLEAEALLAAGRTDAAVDAYLAAASRSQDPRLLGRAAAVAAAADRGDEARALVERWVVLAPDDASAHARRAVLAFEARELDIVIASLARLHALTDPAGAAGLLMEGRPAARAQHVLAAHAAAFPDDKTAHYGHATAAWRSADIATAAAAIARARTLDPEWLDAILLEARILVRRDHDPRSLVELDRRAAAVGAHSELRLIAALLRAEAGDLVGARATLVKEIARDPDSAAARLAFASVAISQGDRDMAAEVLRPASAEPERDDVRLELGRIAEHQGATADALLWYREVVGDEYATAAAAGIARVLRASEGLAVARNFLNEARAGQPAWTSRLFQVEAQLLREAGEDRAARTLLDGAIREIPDPDLRYLRALVASDAGDYAAAERELRALVAATPDDPSLQNALGYTLLESGRKLDEAERLLTAALGASPDEAAILDSYGWLKFRRGDLAAARGYLERALRQDDDAEIAAHLGEVLWTLGERDAARKVWDDAATREPEHRVLAATRGRLTR